jgi:hypothetical protein
VLAELLTYLSWAALAAVFLLGLVWGILSTHRVLHPGIAAGLGAAFFLVVAGIRGLESPTPELSVARTLGTLVLWLVAVGGIALGRRIRS